MKTKTPQQQKTQKYKIVIELAFGPYASTADVAAVKKQVKAKAPKIIFSAVTKTRHGHHFKGRISEVKSIAAPVSYVKQAFQERVPGAKVYVTKV
ncbi:MAG TPA: hypothetical protein VGK06_15995 [Methanosarcina sp.]|jgi:hypothetical protein